MGPAALDVYVRAFLARCVARSRSGQALLDQPGIHGLLPCGRDRQIRLLVTDDRARDLLPTLIGHAGAGMITVCSPAVQCAALLVGNPTWPSGTATAMICRDLQKVSTVGLPPGLQLQPVRRLADDTPRSAGIDASDAGRGLYRRLGFEDATVVTRFRSSP